MNKVIWPMKKKLKLNIFFVGLFGNASSAHELNVVVFFHLFCIEAYCIPIKKEINWNKVAAKKRSEKCSKFNEINWLWHVHRAIK